MSRVSIVVTNHEYEIFLGPCLDSALAQDHPDLEVIVVDDGSTDGSAGVIARYGDDVTAVFQPNGGQGSAFNTGFARSTGDVVIFLDADDLLDAGAASAAAEMLRTPGVVKAHWPFARDRRCRRRDGSTGTRSWVRSPSRRPAGAGSHPRSRHDAFPADIRECLDSPLSRAGAAHGRSDLPDRR